MKDFFQSGRSCDGLFCVTDAAAFGAAQAVREIGRNPGEVFFIDGHDNLRFSPYANPPITTMEQPQDAICQTAVELVLKRLKGEHPRKRLYVFPSELIVRKSGCPLIPVSFTLPEIMRDRHLFDDLVVGSDGKSVPESKKQSSRHRLFMKMDVSGGDLDEPVLVGLPYKVLPQ